MPSISKCLATFHANGIDGRCVAVNHRGGKTLPAQCHQIPALAARAALPQEDHALSPQLAPMTLRSVCHLHACHQNERKRQNHSLDNSAMSRNK
jgi:hypothetical protein